MTSRRPLRVLVVTAMYPKPSAPTLGIFVHEQVETLRRLGAQVDVLYVDGRRGKHQYVLGCARVLTQSIRHRYDVVHGHYGYAGLMARCQWGARTVVTLHGSDVNLPAQRPFARLASRLADETIVVSPALARIGCLPAAHVIPCGVDLSLFQPIPQAAARRALGLDAECHVVLFGGDPARSVKRYDRFQAALAHVQRPVHVLTLSNTPRDRVPLLLNAADCLVLTSDTEGSPTVIREALACNTPVVSVDVGDVRQQIEHATPGEIVASDPAAIAVAIERVLDSGQRSNGRTLLEGLDLETTSRRVHAVYEGTLRRRVVGVAYTEYLSDPRVRREAEALAERGDDVTVLVLAESGQPSREVIRGVKVERLPMRRYRGGGARSYLLGYGQFMLRAFGWLATHGRIDVVHVHTIPDALVFCALVPRLRGSRVVLDIHDLTPDLFALKFARRHAFMWLLRTVERLSLRFADAVITVHEPYAALLAKRGVPRNRLYVVLNTPDDAIFAPLPELNDGATDRVVTFVYHGTLVERYGVEVLLRAFSRARAQNSRMSLRIYGGGDFRPRALELADELGLGDAVEFSPGMVPVDDLPRLLADTDVGVVPNLANTFTRHILPTKLMEYSALGLPAIASRTETVPTYFSSEMVRFVEPGDIDALAEAMVELAADRTRRSRLADSIRSFATQHNWTNYKRVFFNAIDGVAARTGG